MDNPATTEFAEVEQRDQTKPPILTVGKITPQALNNFSDGCEAYFFHKQVADAKQVQVVVLGLKDHRIRDWYRASKVAIIAMSFDDFMVAVKTKLLTDGWEYNLNKDILSSTQGEKLFSKWETELGASNSLLVSSVYYVTQPVLRSHLSANMNPELALDCDAAKTRDIADYDQWLADVTTLDLKRARENEKHKHLVEDAMKTECAKSRVLTGPSIHGNKSLPAGVAVSSSSAPSLVSIPKLTDADRVLLNDHDGCYKCCRFYGKHKGKHCPHGFPDPATYKPLTLASALAAKKKMEKALVAVVDMEPETVITAVGMSSAVIGDGTDSDEYVDPLHSPHIYWDCLADDSKSESFLPVHALIDIGCTTVLINPELVDSLHLTRVPLRKPMEVSLAITLGEERKSYQLRKSVILKLYSVDQAWASKSVRAVVAPGLCTSIILGQSFLTAHSTVIDCKARTVIDKHYGRNILATPIIQKVPPTKLQARRNLPKFGTVRHQKLAVIKELKNTALPYLRHVTDRCGTSLPTKPEQFLGAVRVRVKQLATAAALNKLDTKMKHKFADRFEELPHTDDLPTDIYHRIKLKDAAQVIACRGYACPRKYKTAWDTLIQQHLDAGCIRPSNSPYLSPAFIVPKADEAVLPRWVNDYQKINANTVTDTYPLPRIDDILADCAKGKIWGKIDMTNSFFQTRMHPDNIQYTAVMTP
jgi:hypothetical protein